LAMRSFFSASPKKLKTKTSLPDAGRGFFRRFGKESSTEVHGMNLA